MHSSASLRRLYQVARTVPREEHHLIYRNTYYARTHLVPNIEDEENL